MLIKDANENLVFQFNLIRSLYGNAKFVEEKNKRLKVVQPELFYLHTAQWEHLAALKSIEFVTIE